jgi:membrane-bound lytic murein transglycosylase MltF
VLDRRQALLAAIYGTGDDVFGGEILDCMAGRESAWDPSAVSATGARGLFQITETAWEEIYKGVPNAPEYKLEVWDPARSAAAAAAYLRTLLSRIVGRERYLARDYSESDLKKAIQAYNKSSIAPNYAQEIWECAQRLKAGDLWGALRAIRKIP